MVYFNVREYFIIFLYHIKLVLWFCEEICRQSIPASIYSLSIKSIKNGMSKVNSKTNIFDSYIIFE